MKKIALCLLVVCLCFTGCAVTSKSNYPLHHAASEGNLRKVQELVKAGVPLDDRDTSGYTPLLWALYSAHNLIAEYLIVQGANVNAADKDGNTDIFFAANSCNFKIMKLLVDHKAKVNIKNLFGDTPLHYLASTCLSYNNEMAAIMEYLLEKGCDLNAVNKRGKTVYAVAIEYKNMDMVAWLRRKGVTEKFQDPAGAMHEGLRRPSFYAPPAGLYAVPTDRQLYYELAIEDCNHYTVPYKKGWLFGPLVYAVELDADKDRGTENFDKCMKTMGFEKK